MKLSDKYNQVIDQINKLEAYDKEIKEESGKLKLTGTVNTMYEKNIIWDKIKQIGGENPNDLVADIKVKNNEYFALHTVTSGETLSEISKKYYGNPNRYNDIAKYNNIENPNKINVGQNIKIPNP